MQLFSHGKRKITFRSTWPLHLLILPGLLIVVVYTIIPFLGNIIAFQDFRPILGFEKSKWVGFANFEYMFRIKDTLRVFGNSLRIASFKLLFMLVASIIFALLLHEASSARYKKIVQTVCFLPHFLSWVILATIFRNIFSNDGLVNSLLGMLGLTSESINFLGSNSWFSKLLIGTDVWKEFGYSSIIFIAALTGVNLELYEAADIDGASRLRKIWHISLPAIATTIVLVATLSLANILNAGFDQVYNMYSPVVYESGDIIDTYVYRMSFNNAQYSIGTAVGLLKSAISFILLTISYSMAHRFTGFKLF